MPTAAFTTLGCKVNQYETQRILETFEDAGFAVVPFDAPADVYVVNTCSVTSIAESKSRYTIRRAHRNNPLAKVVVTGCATQMALNKREALEGADVVVPNPLKLEALSYLFQAFPGLEREAREQPRSAVAAPRGRTRATLKVQDGCSVFCSYCSIPYTRPVMSSRPWREVLSEAEHLVETGYREVVLTGVLIGAYGRETGSGGPDFEELVERLCKVEGLERIRISSIELRQVTPRLIDLVGTTRVVPHLHIPLQSGDTGVLRDMNRPYTQDDYLRLCGELYDRIPDLSLTTDILVGFPTEDEQRFSSSVEACERARFLKAHIFRFSPRHGTPADRWGDPVPPDEKVRRSKALGDVAARLGQAHAKRFLGRTLRVLVEGKTRDGLLHGLTDNYLDVRFAGPTTAAGQLVHISLSDIKDGVLYGEQVPDPASHLTPLAVRA